MYLFCILLGLLLSASLTFMIIVFLLSHYNDIGNSQGKIDDFSREVRILSNKEKKFNYNPSAKQRAESYRNDYDKRIF